MTGGTTPKNQPSSPNKTSTKKKEPLKISELPSFARVCFNVIMLEEVSALTSSRIGYLVGSVSMPIFEVNH